MWSKDHAGTQSAITGFSWSPPLHDRAHERLQREHLSRYFTHAVRAYSLVTAESLASTLGVPLDTVHQMASAAGWTTDAESGAYVPCAAPDEAKARPPVVETLAMLTDYVAHVEKSL